MVRFLSWRKMTWLLIAWNAAFGAWTLGLVLAGSGTAGCSVDAAGAAAGSLAKQDCLDNAARGMGLAPVVLIWVVGLVALVVVWFSTRPLWRQGHGARFRRLSSAEFLADKRPRRFSSER
jgi:hypothetical protein